MPDDDHVLSPAAARAFYDRLGTKQDWQGFYENPALAELITHARFEDALNVFEFGCGTGKFAARLLLNHLPAPATYIGCDVSPIMIGIARRRITQFGARARVVASDGAVQFPLPDHSVDRVVSTYVLDLLSDTDIRRFFAEARRALAPHGKLCLVSLATGVRVPSRIVTWLWTAVFRRNPTLVGGCRPVDLDSFVDPRHWRFAHRHTVAPFGVPSAIRVLDTTAHDT